MYSVYRGNLPLVKKLIKLKSNIFEVNNEGNALLHLSVISDQANLMVYLKEKYLLSVYAVNRNGLTPLHFACFYASENCFNILLSWVDNVNEKNEDGNTPLHFLVLTGNFFIQ